MAFLFEGSMEHTINRVKNKTKNYTVVSNEIFQRADVSARAKGIYSYIMTLPDDWKLYKSELYKHFSEGKEAINKAFHELEELGYISKEKVKDENGKYSGWKYHIVESIESTDCPKNRKSESPNSVNPPLLNTNIELNTNKIYIDYLEKWNELGIIKHSEKIAAARWKKKHTDAVNLYGKEKVYKAMENYATVLSDPSYFFNYKWPLWDFLVRGLDKFVDEADPFHNFKAKKIDGKKSSDPYYGLNL